MSKLSEKIRDLAWEVSSIEDEIKSAASNFADTCDEIRKTKSRSIDDLREEAPQLISYLNSEIKVLRTYGIFVPSIEEIIEMSIDDNDEYYISFC